MKMRMNKEGVCSPRTDIPKGPYERECKEIKDILTEALSPVEGEDLVVEFFQDGDTLTVKVRKVWNDFLEGLSLEDLSSLLGRVRALLNKKNTYRKAKLQSSIHFGAFKEKTNIRVVYNPKWRRYENYEIFFRNRTQSQRKVFKRSLA